MYTILLVDDERWIRESIKEKGNWEEQGFEIIAEASNGLEAMHTLQELHPDVVFTDIRMPGCSGLELIEQMRRAGYSTEVVVISGYSEFAFARKAMQHGAVDYLLKPTEEKDITEVLASLKIKLDEKKEALHLKLLFSLSSTLAMDELEVTYLLSELNLPWIDDGFTAIAVVGMKHLPIEDKIPYIRLQYGRNTSIYLMQTRDSIYTINCLSMITIESVKGIGVGTSAQSIDQIRHSIDTAIEAACHFFMKEETGSIYRYCSIKVYSGSLLAEFATGFRARDLNRVKAACEALLSYMKSDQCGMNEVLMIHNTILSLANFEDQEKIEEYTPTVMELISTYSHVSDMMNRLEAQIKAVLRVDNTEVQVSHEKLQLALDYMSENYNLPLSVQHIAEKLNLNPNYVSTLFQKELKTTFTQTLTDIRMRHACAMLLETNMTINEIAERVGYLDYFYFAKTFKKIFNVTPTNYRQSVKIPY